MKKWLKDNKIYFETIVAILLSIMAIIVSCQSNSISKNAITISKIEHLPKISAQFRLDNGGLGKREETLVINNSGDVMYDFKAYPFQFLRINEIQLLSLKEKSKPLYLKSIEIPIINYYTSISYISNVNKGVFSETKIENSEKLSSILPKVISDNKSKIKSLGISIDRYLFVSYKDKFDDVHNDYFRFDYAGTSIPMSKHDGESLKETYDRSLKNNRKSIDYNNVTSSEINKIWSN